ncbi:MAG: hypothetical protein AAFN08_07740 [Cyanobacteria bacterium J06559_3]
MAKTLIELASGIRRASVALSTFMETLLGSVDAAAARQTLGVGLVTTNVQSGAAYTLALVDGSNSGNVIVEMTSASANTATIPTNSSVAFPIGAEVIVAQIGAGVTSVAPDSGVTLNGGSSSIDIPAQYQMMYLRKRATDDWVAVF